MNIANSPYGAAALAALALACQAGCKPQPQPREQTQAAALAAVAAPAETPAAKPLPDYADALVWAWKFASAIPVDPHGEDRGKCQYQALKAYVDLGFEAEAARQATEIMNWQRGVLYADLGAACARRDDAGKTLRHYLDLARAWRDGLDPDEFNVAWHRDRITGHMALALAKAGLFAEAEAMALGVEDPDLPQMAIEKFSKIDTAADYERAVKELDAMSKVPVFEMQEAAVQTWIRILKNQGKTMAPARLTEILARVQDIVPRLPGARQCLVRCAVARALLDCGQHDPGLKLLEEAVAALKKGKLNAQFDVANLAEVARTYDRAAALPDRAGEMLQQAAVLLKESGPALGRSDRHAATVALAVGYAMHGDRDVAWGYFRAALAEAQGQVNGRPRHMMLTELCIAIGRCRYALPAAFRTGLEQPWNRRGDPW